MTTGEWLTNWNELRAGDLAPRTVERNEQLIAMCAPLAGMPLEEIDPDEIQRLLTAICAAGHSRTAEQVFVMLATAMKQAVKLHKIDSSPMEAVMRPKHKKKPIRVWTEDETARYCAKVHGDPHELELLLPICCGLRRGEVCGLRWSDIDVDAGVIHVRNQRIRLDSGQTIDTPPKSEAGLRDIPLPEGLRRLVRARRQISGYVTRLTPSGLYQAHRRACKAANVPSYGLHSERHTMATDAVRGGIPLKVLQVVLGHAKYETTANTYTHPDADMCMTVIARTSRFVV